MIRKIEVKSLYVIHVIILTSLILWFHNRENL